MNNVWTLLKVQMLNFFGINKIIHSKDKKTKRKAVGFAALMVFAFIYMAAMVFALCYGMGQALLQLGALEHLPTVIMAITTMMILVTTIYKVNGTLFGFKDYDMTMSLPVKTGELVASRVILLYTMNVFFAFAIMIPAGVAYAVIAKPAFGFYPIYILLMLTVPLVPIIAASLIGTLISMISSRFKHSGAVNLIVSLIFFVAIFTVSFSMGSVSETEFINFGRVIGEMTTKIYPLAILFTSAICDMNIVALLGFIAISAALFGGFAFLVGVIFKWLNTGAMTTRAAANYKMKSLKTSSAFTTLYKKEIKRLFGSTVYILNTGVGCLMLLIMSVAVGFFGGETVEQALKIPGLSALIASYSPLVFAGILSMTSTTSASISLEGKNLWIIKSAPVSEKTIFASKLAVNLTLMLPTILISGLIFIFAFKFGLREAAMLLIFPTIYAVFFTLLGLVINLQHPHLDWLNEAVVVKQSIAILLSMLFGVLSVLPPILGVIFIKAVSTEIILLATGVIFIFVDIILYRYLLTKGAMRFRKL